MINANTKLFNGSDSDGRIFHIALIAILGLAALLRAGAVYAIGETNPDTTDIWEYGDIARLWIEHGYIARDLELADGTAYIYPTAFMPPLPIWLWRGLFALFGDSSAALWAFLAINWVMSLVLVVLTGLIGWALFQQRWVALIVMAIMAVYPTFVASVATYHVIQIYLVLLQFGIWWTLRSELLGPRDAVLLGVVGGLAALTRTEYVILFGAIFVAGFLLRGSLRSFILATVISAAVVMPWTARNYVVFDEFIPIANSMGLNLFRGFNPLANGSGDWSDNNGVNRKLHGAELESVPLNENYETNKDNILKRAALEYMAAEPFQAFVVLPLKKVALFWVYDFHDRIVRHPAFQLSFWPVFLFTLAGIYLAVRRRKMRAHHVRLLLCLFIAQTTVMMFYAVHLRYRMNMEPILFSFAASALVTGYQSLQNKLRIHGPSGKSGETDDR